MAFSAWIDESMRYRSNGTAIYTLAAAIISEADVNSIREDVRMLAGSRRPRVHWRDADDSERHKLVHSVGSLDAVHVVVVGTRLERVRQERGRRHCLRRLLWEGNNLGVTHATLEARTAALDRADLAAVAAWRARGELPAALRIDFGRPYGPHGEPLLWLPDIVAGAVSAARGDKHPQYLTALRHVVTEHVIELT